MRLWNWTLAVALISGCTGEHPLDDLPAADLPAAELGVSFDPATTGAIAGNVLWEGPIPNVPPFATPPSLDSQTDMPPRGTFPNSHAPRIDPVSRGVAGAVVFLRHVNLRTARPWNHDSVGVEQEGWMMRVCQGESVSIVGFVRRGETFSAISKQKVVHILWGEGASFFSMPFPDPFVASTRRLTKNGRVELASGADFRWMRGHLFVDDHPYYTRTDSLGRFELEEVPPGVYCVVCWLPNWKIAWQERDPESCQQARVGYQPPLERSREVNLTAHQAANVEFVISGKSFGP